MVALFAHECQAIIQDAAGIAFHAVFAIGVDVPDPAATHHDVADTHAEIKDIQAADGLAIEKKLDARALPEGRPT
jgi:hypothetical protein